jgi:cold shock CspA family protein
MRGTVVSWGVSGQYGWIWCRYDREKYFVHRDDLIDVLTLTPGEKVEFEAVTTVKGPRATNVRPLALAGDH